MDGGRPHSTARPKSERIESAPLPESTPCRILSSHAAGAAGGGAGRPRRRVCSKILDYSLYLAPLEVHLFCTAAQGQTQQCRRKRQAKHGKVDERSGGRLISDPCMHATPLAICPFALHPALPSLILTTRNRRHANVKDAPAPGHA